MFAKSAGHLIALSILAVLAIMVLATPSPANQTRRIALVIGNSDYQHVSKLPNPANDAKDIGAVLERLGFEVTAGTDLDYNQMRLVLRDFAEAATGADVSLVYFAGHGVEIDNTNYLIPVNAELKRDRDVDFEAIRLDAVVDALSDAKGLKIVLVDACRNNPFLVEMERTSATRSIGRGLARMDPSGVLVGYAARGGTLALDGEGRNSPYAQALLRHIEEPGLEIGKLFRKVRDTVYDMTGGAQEPFTYGSLPGEDIFLIPAVAPVAGAAAASAVELQMVEDFAAADVRPSLAGWIAFVERYAAYPDNSLMKLAIRRRDALQAIEDARRRAAERKPWLEVEFGSGKPEMTRDQRILFQRSLSYMGFDVGSPDGEFGPRTQRAISGARFKAGLSAGTVIDAALLRAMPDPRAFDALKSPKAQSHDLAELPDDLDPRLRRAVEQLRRTPFRFDYHEGRLYLAVRDSSKGWAEASRTARSMGGHLVTIASAAENQFVFDLFSSDPDFITSDGSGALFGPFIGLFQVPGSPEPGGGWTWETGEPLAYTNWSPGNPDNFQGRQGVARFFRGPGARNRNLPPRFWDDTPSGPWGPGYIIEIE